MLTKLRPHLTYANVMSSLAVFLVLAGGTAYASHLVVNSSDITDDSIVSADLKNYGVKRSDIGLNSINTDRIEDGAIANPDIGLSAVTSAKVLGNTLTGADINESTLGQVPNAASAPVSGLQIVSSALWNNPANTQSFGVAYCPSGKAATGGGVFAEAAITQHVNSSWPYGTGWAAYVNNASTTTAASFYVYAICVDAAGAAALSAPPDPPARPGR